MATALHPFARASLVAFGLAGCEPTAQPSNLNPSDDERAWLIQCCQGMAHEAWNSDPPNAMVLHAARSCEDLARGGALAAAREQLRAAGHATACEQCPPNGCRPVLPVPSKP